MSISPKEPYAGYDAERTSRAIILLSLDSLAPFLPLVEHRGVPTDGRFRDVVRQIILGYRRFDDDSRPALEGFAAEAMARELDKKTADAFLFWLEHVFVFSAEDYRPYDAWTWLLHDIFKGRVVLGDSFGFPPAKSPDLVAHGRAALSMKEFRAVQDRMEGIPLSEWDTDMYARHQLYEEFKDPDIPMELTHMQLRYRRYVGELFDRLSPEELERFEHTAAAGFAVSGTYKSKLLPDLRSQVLPDADDLH